MPSFPSSPEAAVQVVIAVSCGILGLSHIFQPAMWRSYFVALHRQGTSGVITRTFLFEIWPALFVLTLHPVWSGPGIVVTIYGWLLFGKATTSLLVPSVGVRSLRMAAPGDGRFVAAGMVLLIVAAAAGTALLSSSS